MTTEQDRARATYRRRWHAVAERERTARQAAPLALQWQQFQAVTRLGQGLRLSSAWSLEEHTRVRQRWQRLKGYRHGETRDLLLTGEEEYQDTMLPEPMTSLLEPLLSVQRLLSRFQNQGMIIGGVAASLLGRPRLTADIDVLLLLSVDDVPALVAAAAEEGLLPRFTDAAACALAHEQSGFPVDIALGCLPFEQEAVERSQCYQVEALTLRLPTPEDLIILKAVAHRPRDLEDIRAVIERHPDLDRERVKQWVSTFAEALEATEMWTTIAEWLL